MSSGKRIMRKSARVASDFQAEVQRRFPRIPSAEAKKIARYSCALGSERVGELSAADGYLDHAIELAVIAHIRHRHTNYHQLLAHGVAREDARERVRPLVESYLRAWDSDRT